MTTFKKWVCADLTSSILLILNLYLTKCVPKGANGMFDPLLVSVVSASQKNLTMQ